MNLPSAFLTLLTAVLTTPGGDSAVIAPPRGGNTLVQAHGLAVSRDSSYDQLQLPNSCQCIGACRISPKCWSVSFSEKNGGDCRLLKKGPITRTEIDPDAVYYYAYRVGGLGGSKVKIVRERDDLYYFFQTKVRSYEEAKERCEKWPGFHLPIIITRAHYDALVHSDTDSTAFKSFFIDLHINASGSYVWGNGLDFNTTTQVNLNMGITESNEQANRTLKIFMVNQGKFNDGSSKASAPVVCQANLDGVPWN